MHRARRRRHHLCQPSSHGLRLSPSHLRPHCCDEPYLQAPSTLLPRLRGPRCAARRLRRLQSDLQDRRQEWWLIRARPPVSRDPATSVLALLASRDPTGARKGAGHASTRRGDGTTAARAYSCGGARAGWPRLVCPVRWDGSGDAHPAHSYSGSSPSFSMYHQIFFLLLLCWSESKDL